ncbi:MAG: bifunctional alpha/beta hydrolase/OsmC family protein [Pacificimonas sp.]
MATTRIEFENAKSVKLAGALELPPGRIRGAALFAHCFTCTAKSRGATRISRALARVGIATLRFDFTGLGGSEGDFANGGFMSDVDDIVSAAAWLKDWCPEDVGEGLILVGHSLGGAAVLAAAHKIPHVDAIATIGAPADVPHVLERIDGDLDAILQKGEGEVNISGRPFTIGAGFIDSVRDTDLLASVAKLRQPLLILHSPVDNIVGVENARALYEAARHPKSYVSLDDADHLMLKERDAHYAASVIAAWAERYLPPAAEADSSGVVVETGHGKFGTQVTAGAHSWVSDEPKSYGGEDAGPTPYDHLLAALGTCTAMTLKFYAEREGIPMTSARVTLTHERDHVHDSEHAADEDEAMQAIYRKIELSGDLTDKQRAQLMVIADRCPVHKTLEGELHVHSELVGD